MNCSRPSESTTSSRVRVSDEDEVVSVDRKKRPLAVVPAAAMDGKFFLEDAADATLANREAAREDDASNVITIDVDYCIFLLYCCCIPLLFISDAIFMLAV